MGFFDRLKLGYSAFREGYVTANVVDTTDWTDQNARELRYQVLWAQYEGTSYRDVHTWTTEYRKQYSLYEYVRPIYNPAWRLGEFWKAHLYGGTLDADAGTTGAIPILTDNDDLRPAIAELWKWSMWQANKDIMTVRGAILGDTILQVVDDISQGRVYLRTIYPGSIDTIDKDNFGNVKGYVIQEIRILDDRSVTYREEVTRDGQFVVYQTFMNGEPYAWPDNVQNGQPVSYWAEPYGFVPLVAIQHNDVGLDWGWSELHPVRAKIQEADDVASMLSDQIRKHLQPVWMAKGMKEVASLTTSGADASTDSPAPGREEERILYTGSKEDVDIQALIANLDFGAAEAHLAAIVREIERDVLELSQDIHTASGSASGRALRTVRQPVISKVMQRRINYDAGLVSAQQMALAIGGFRGYNGYKSFGLDSYAKGDLDHTIAERNVFAEDPLDAAEIATANWEAAQAAIATGVSLQGYLRTQGWDDEQIAVLGIAGEIDDSTEPNP